MKFPKCKATDQTEAIMREVVKELPGLRTSIYNRIFSATWKILSEQPGKDLVDEILEREGK